ncbi:MAG: hypothetical protein NTW61_07645 [Candidatus Melainabacteria bacterium]|nr:hypothetical protein [Candidatus Melainabacteria bacterium]
MSIMTLSSPIAVVPVIKRQWLKQTVAVMALVLLVVGSTLTGAVEAKGTRGHITGRSVAAGALSLIIWPGIGQAVNSQPGKKVATHAIIGLFPPYRFWSGYDALFDRQGGYWEGRI